MAGLRAHEYKIEKQGISLINRREERIFNDLIAKQQTIEQYNNSY